MGKNYPITAVKTPGSYPDNITPKSRSKSKRGKGRPSNVIKPRKARKVNYVP